MTDPNVDAVHRILRGSSTADIRFDQHLRPVRYVIDGEGRLVMPAMVAMLTAEETVLFVPEYADDAVELLVTLEAFEDAGADGARADRWRIYHGEPEDVRWARCWVEAAKHDVHVIDGEALELSNPLRDVEARLCKALNGGDTAALQAYCKAQADVDVESPIVVGIDATGIDVRRRFDVVRVPVGEPMSDEDAARRTLASLLGN